MPACHSPGRYQLPVSQRCPTAASILTILLPAPAPPSAVCRVLLKEPAVSEITPRDVFRFNPKYTSRLYRVKINNLQMQ